MKNEIRGTVFNLRTLKTSLWLFATLLLKSAWKIPHNLERTYKSKQQQQQAWKT